VSWFTAAKERRRRVTRDSSSDEYGGCTCGYCSVRAAVAAWKAGAFEEPPAEVVRWVARYPKTELHHRHRLPTVPHDDLVYDHRNQTFVLVQASSSGSDRRASAHRAAQPEA
jgi:hypothetical protein